MVIILTVAVTLASAQGKTEVKRDETGYQNFNVEIFCCIQNEQKMIADHQWIEESWNLISHSIKIDKVYLETYRDNEIMPEENIKKLKNFFIGKGVKVSGGIMASVAGPSGDRLNGFCYLNPIDREKFRKIMAYTASLFDEIIFDDLFIFNCQCDLCQKAKGDLPWAEYRLKVMKEVGEDLVVKNARGVNPKIHLIFKPPNWYEQYQFSGYNLESQPKVFDEIRAGTETRDPENTVQHLQQYQSYSIMRYFEHIKPGNFGGGWVDVGQRQTLNRYTEQLENTLFAKPKAIIHWSYGSLVETINDPDGNTKMLSLIAEAAGYTFYKLDAFLGKLGEPYGVVAYKPYNSSGEMYIHNYFGMIGVPMDLYPDFPDNHGTVFFTEHAKFDP